MTLRLRIVHETTFAYEGQATASYNQARLTPRTTPEQLVWNSRVEVSPTPWMYTYTDYFGAQVTAFEVVDPHDMLSVVSTSTVQVNRSPSPGPQLSWDELRRDDVLDAHVEYLVTTPLVRPPADLAARAASLAAQTSGPSETARALGALVHEEVDYLRGSTTVMTHAADAWQQRAGVCQDMTHLVIGALRSVGVPARYVSGYLHPSSDPRVAETVVGESHAWVEWWDDGWHAWDVANATEPLDRHVVVAAGRDYDDVRPLSGIYSGAATSSMTVEVRLTRL